MSIVDCLGGLYALMNLRAHWLIKRVTDGSCHDLVFRWRAELTHLAWALQRWDSSLRCWLLRGYAAACLVNHCYFFICHVLNWSLIWPVCNDLVIVFLVSLRREHFHIVLSQSFLFARRVAAFALSWRPSDWFPTTSFCQVTICFLEEFWIFYKLLFGYNWLPSWLMLRYLQLSYMRRSWCWGHFPILRIKRKVKLFRPGLRLNQIVLVRRLPLLFDQILVTQNWDLSWRMRRTSKWNLLVSTG